MSQRTLHQPRERRIEMVKRRLLRKSTPRLQVSLILVLTGLAGFLVSYSLLHLHVLGMWLRYPIVILVSYGVFLLLLRIWLWVQGRHWNVDVDLSLLDHVPSPEPESFHTGGGGDFGGAGSGGSWGESVTPPGKGGSSGGIDFGLDLDELAFVVLALVAVAAALLASLYVVYIAPTLLAEILVDGVLMTGLYKRLTKTESRHWLQTAVRQTVLPALLVAIFFGLAGYFLQKAVPGAHSIGEVWRQLN